MIFTGFHTIDICSCIFGELPFEIGFFDLLSNGSHFFSSLTMVSRGIDILPIVSSIIVLIIDSSFTVIVSIDVTSLTALWTNYPSWNWMLYECVGNVLWIELKLNVTMNEHLRFAVKETVIVVIQYLAVCFLYKYVSLNG